MAWPLKYLGELTPDYDQDLWQPGDLFSVDIEKWWTEDRYLHYPAQYLKQLSDYYRENNAHRLPLFVVLPTFWPFLIDGKCHSTERGYYGGWTVTGEPTNLTVHPSINIGGSYHGYITNGVLTDDCEGRTYSSEGRILTGPGARP